MVFTLYQFFAFEFLNEVEDTGKSLKYFYWGLFAHQVIVLVVHTTCYIMREQKGIILEFILGNDKKR